MRDILENRLAKIETPERKRDVVREFLQHLLLSILDRRRAFQHWAFVGGTALRVLYDIRRFSEDLDFSAIVEVGKALDIRPAAEVWRKDLADWGFTAEIGNLKALRSVQSCFVQFPGLYAELGLSADPRQKLSIKCEVDQNPPRGYAIETSVVQKDLFFTAVHHDLPSLFAGKLHAVLFRKFVKGRDLYDLLWYLTRQTPVNLKFLQNAALQTEGKSLVESEEELQTLLSGKLSTLEFSKARTDLAPFLEDPHELQMIDRPIFLQAVRKIRCAR
jgi:hypothetical protein